MNRAVEVITSVERRRRWSASEKERLVSASLEPGASVCAVAREGIFHYLLTPNFNVAHRNHLHLDIKRGLKEWTIE